MPGTGSHQRTLEHSLSHNSFLNMDTHEDSPSSTNNPRPKGNRSGSWTANTQTIETGNNRAELKDNVIDHFPSTQYSPDTGFTTSESDKTLSL